MFWLVVYGVFSGVLGVNCTLGLTGSRFSSVGVLGTVRHSLAGLLRG